MVWYHPGLHFNFNDENRTLGRWQDVYHMIGGDLCHLILTKSGTVIEKATVQHVTRDDMIDSKTVEQVENINTDSNERLDDTRFYIPTWRGRINLRS